MANRWEWRTFGASFGAAEAALAALTLDPVKESDELYLLGRDAETVKIRDDLMDVKTLREVDENGLEQWQASPQARLPAVGRRRPRGPRRAARRARLPGPRVVRPDRAARGGHRRDRRGPPGAGPQAPRPHDDRWLRGRGQRGRGRGPGDPDRGHRIGGRGRGHRRGPLARARRTSSTPATRAAWPRCSTGRAARYGVIDVGTNSVKLHVGELDADGTWHSVLDRAVVTRLGEGLGATADRRGGHRPHGRRHRRDRRRGAELGALAVAVGRDGRPARGAQRRGRRPGHRARGPASRAGGHLRRRGGPPRVRRDEGASGPRRGRRGRRLRHRRRQHAVHVRRTARGSTGASACTSAPSARPSASAWTSPSTLEVIDDALAAIGAGPRRDRRRRAADALVGMGGAVTNLAAVDLAMAVYDPDAVRARGLTAPRSTARSSCIRSARRRWAPSIVGLQPARAEVILAGACIVRTVMDLLGHDTLTVSDRGLRHGLLVERFGPSAPGGTP